MKKTIFIPYHQQLDELCDFVFQTVKILLDKGYYVNLILYNYAYLFGDKYNKNTFSNAYCRLLQHKNFSITRPFIKIIPKKGLRRLYKLNQDIFENYLTKKISREKKPVLWVFWPEDVYLVNLIKNIYKSKIICLYDCVDNFTHYHPKRSLTIVREQEKKLLALCDFVSVNSHSLYSLKHKYHKDIKIVPLGFDHKSFTHQNGNNFTEIDQIFKNIPKPIIGYLGYFSFRINTRLLINLINKLSKVSFVLIGSIRNSPDEPFDKLTAFVKRFKSFPNAYLIPPIVKKTAVSKALKYFNVGIIPYLESNEFNKYCYPMKLFEYFYCGKPVISTPIEELKRFPKYVKIGETVKEWETHIKNLLQKSWPKKYKEEQRKLAIENSWENKINKILKIIKLDQK